MSKQIIKIFQYSYLILHKIFVIKKVHSFHIESSNALLLGGDAEQIQVLESKNVIFYCLMHNV